MNEHNEQPTWEQFRKQWLRRTIPLVPRHDIRLTALDGDGQRFARLFRETWARIPLYARRSILRHWRAWPLPPNIELLRFWGQQGLAADYFTLGQITNHGCEMRFCAPWMDALPDAAVQWIIAHELAHVYHVAEGVFPDDEDGREFEADEEAMHWGFDENAKPAWFIEHAELADRLHDQLLAESEGSPPPPPSPR